MGRLLLLCSCLLFCFTSIALAEIYQYTDEDGILHVVDDLESVPKKYRKKMKTGVSGGSVSTVESKRGTSNRSASGASQEVTVEVYTTSWCGYCTRLKNDLRAQGVSFTEYDIEADKAAAATYRSFGVRGVPVTRVGDQIVQGYNPQRIIQLVRGR